MTTPHRFPVDVLIVVARGGLILLTERAGDTYLAGHWAIPGGKVEAGEDAVTGAVRELDEEVGLAAHPDDLRFIGVTHHRPPHGDSRVGFGFLLDVTGDTRPANKEPDKCSRLAWCDPRQLPVPTMPYTAEVVRLYLDEEPFSLHGWEQ